MKTFAEIKDGAVVNTSVWDTEMPQGEQFVEITGSIDSIGIGIGWAYINGQFIEPVRPEPETPESETPIIEGQ